MRIVIRSFLLAGLMALITLLSQCGKSGPPPPHFRFPILEPLVTITAYYPYIESVELPEEPVPLRDMVQIRLKLFFPEGTPSSLVLSHESAFVNPPGEYVLETGETVSSFPGTNLLGHPTSPRIKELCFTNEGVLTRHKWYPGFVNEGIVGEISTDWLLTLTMPATGQILLLAAGSPEDSGFIEWRAPATHTTYLSEEDLAWWNEHAYADGKLKWFYYEYPVLLSGDGA